MPLLWLLIGGVLAVASLIAGHSGTVPALLAEPGTVDPASLG
ncbi:MAG: hypothetical protein ACR2J5_01260 [Geodermatophilaceae bacterium]